MTYISYSQALSSAAFDINLPWIHHLGHALRHAIPEKANMKVSDLSNITIFQFQSVFGCVEEY